MDMVQLFKGLGDDTRLRIMLLLQAMELSVGEMAAVLAQSQPRVSRHLKILDDAGLVERRKEGNWVFLRPALPRLNSPAAALLDAFLRRDDALGQALAQQQLEDRARLQAIIVDREQRAAEFFAQHADHWDSIRSLHIPETKVEAALEELIGNGHLGRFLDIGTGTGRMIELFADRAKRCIGLDRSPEMLRSARAKLQHRVGTEVDLVLADFYALPCFGTKFDTIMLHQVLHYAQDPQAVIDEAGKVAADGAKIVIVDFATHALEELRERHAHARLGFSDDQVLTMLTKAGFAHLQTRNMSGGTLTVKIWLGRRQNPSQE